ncbi:hypothetical protein DSC45_21540 [Streptomyces sp. YIM 130001]|uniref:hypothetical protein n=1 Tax=Streptomyces sp. YIM 130001 TaxID=2259644 RepID=UPI000E646304|nr:hypothetical protein [Streptomyces sp. YIM 130001]RII14275.1 hypothetical protein DSC45_21540 [Streptomyces sp. YIM 130001]
MGAWQVKSTGTAAAVGRIAAVMLFFLAMFISDQQRFGGGLGEAVLMYAAVALPGGALAAWFATRGRQ